MDYTEKFREMIINSLIGYVIGLVIALALIVGLAKENPTEAVLEIVGFMIFFGSIAAIIVCAKRGTKGFMSEAVYNIWVGFKNLFFGALFTGSIFSLPFLIWGVFKFIIGLIILIPVALYMAVAYVFNMIYLGVMCVLEKLNKLENRRELCDILDKLVPVLSLVVTAVGCVLILRSM